VILICLAEDDDERAVRTGVRPSTEAAVVRVVGTDAGGAASAGAWLLRSDRPARPLWKLARRIRARSVVFGPKAWEAWGRDFEEVIG
jgi:hypothetical protein